MAKRTLQYLGESPAYVGRWVSIIKRRFLDAAGVEQVFEVVRSIRGKQFVVILPVTEDNRVVFIRQQRVNLVDDSASGDRRYCVQTIELPAGFVGRDQADDEKVIKVATHELQEETGYRVLSPPIILARHVPCEIGRNDGEVTLVFARCTRERAQALEDSEVIDVCLVPVREVARFLDGKPYVDSLACTALYLAEHRGLI